MVRNVREEEDDDIPRGDLAQIHVELRTEADRATRQIQFDPNQNLAVRGDHDLTLAVQHIGGQGGVGEFDPCTNDERRGEGRREPAHGRVGLEGLILPDDLLSQPRQPYLR